MVAFSSHLPPIFQVTEVKRAKRYGFEHVSGLEKWPKIEFFAQFTKLTLYNVLFDHIEGVIFSKRAGESRQFQQIFVQGCIIVRLNVVSCWPNLAELVFL